MIMKEKLSEFLKEHGPKHWSFAARKDNEFMAWVMEQTSTLPEDTPFSSRVFAAVSETSPVCKQGNTRPLNTLEKGWRFCGRAGVCPCAREAVSSSMKASAKNVDQKASKAKAMTTLMSRYGVTNAGQTSKAKNAHREFYENPDKVAQAVERGRASMMKKYGVDNALKLPIDRLAIAQRNLTEEAKATLNDKEKFEKLVESNSSHTVAMMLGVNTTTINNYIRAHDIQVHGSSFEREIESFLRENLIQFRSRDRKVIAPFELDFYLPEHGLAIEFNGLYYHSDEVVENDYHRVKWERCRDAGIRLLMINEDEWVDRPQVMKSKILNLCGLSTRGVGARSLTVRIIPSTEAKMFLDHHHIQGSPSTITDAFGAFHGGRLVAVISFGKQRTTGVVELSRFCSDGLVYPGVFSKILKYASSTIDGKIITFADLRYSDGGLYEKTGFVRTDELRPDYKYVKRNKTYHKSLFTKARIAKKFGLDMTGLTEKEAMKMNGYSRIYDCGKIKYELIPKSV